MPRYCCLGLFPLRVYLMHKVIYVFSACFTKNTQRFPEQSRKKQAAVSHLSLLCCRPVLKCFLLLFSNGSLLISMFSSSVLKLLQSKECPRLCLRTASWSHSIASAQTLPCLFVPGTISSGSRSSPDYQKTKWEDLFFPLFQISLNIRERTTLCWCSCCLNSG